MTATLGAVDKVAISTAAIYGLKDDLHLVGQQYSWAGSILSIGVRLPLGCPFALLLQLAKKSRRLSECGRQRILSTDYRRQSTSLHARPDGLSWPFSCRSLGTGVG